MDWGGPPKDPKNPGPNEWNTVHSIAISADRRLFVVDRGHQRMQVFDENGKFLDMWPLRSPHWPANQTTLMVNHLIDHKGFIWVGDAPTARMLKFDLNGNLLYSWGAPGGEAGRLELLARHHDGSARQPVPRRLLHGTGAEVRADPRRARGEARGADPADVGYMEAFQLTRPVEPRP